MPSLREASQLPEFMRQGVVPFALASCERFNVHPVSGHYNEQMQIWEGDKDITAALTLTLTATPGDQDQDHD